MKYRIHAIVITLLICWISSLQLHAQDGKFLDRKLSLHWVPLAVIDYTPRWRFGTEWKAGDRIGVGLDLGVGSKFLNPVRALHNSLYQKEAYRFFEVRPELKLYSKAGSKYLNSYWGLEGFFLLTHKHFYNGHYHPVEPDQETKATSSDGANIVLCSVFG